MTAPDPTPSICAATGTVRHAEVRWLVNLEPSVYDTLAVVCLACGEVILVQDGLKPCIRARIVAA